MTIFLHWNTQTQFVNVMIIKTLKKKFWSKTWLNFFLYRWILRLDCRCYSNSYVSEWVAFVQIQIKNKEKKRQLGPRTRNREIIRKKANLTLACLCWIFFSLFAFGVLCVVCVYACMYYIWSLCCCCCCCIFQSFFLSFTLVHFLG